MWKCVCLLVVAQHVVYSGIVRVFFLKTAAYCIWKLVISGVNERKL